MVWEQGSVVIVSLTKLTENGVAMCHRYWPEEGSELYHIYEVPNHNSVVSLYFYLVNRARKSRRTLQNKVRIKVFPEQFTLFLNTFMVFKK